MSNYPVSDFTWKHFGFCWRSKGHNRRPYFQARGMTALFVVALDAAAVGLLISYIF